MSRPLINAFSFLNGAFGFCQWLYYLSLLHFTEGYPSSFFYSAVLLQYAPMSLVPFFLKNRMELSANGKWFCPISLLGVVTGLLFCSAVFFRSLPVFYGSLFIVSSLSGACIGLFLTLPSKLTTDIQALQSAQSKIAVGYYAGVLLASLTVSLSFGFYRFSLLSIAAVFSQMAAFFVIRRAGVQKLEMADPSPRVVMDLPSLFEEGSRVKGYLLMTGVRYFAWGIIAFFFPVTVVQHFSMSTNAFALVAAASMVSMTATSFWLGTPSKISSKNYRVSAGLSNILNGVFVATAYLSPSFSLFVLFFLLASIVSIIADIKTTSSFIGNSSFLIRGRLSALTSSLRFGGLVIGNLFSILLVQPLWYLGPLAICLLLSIAGVSCFWILSTRGYDVIQDSELA